MEGGGRSKREGIYVTSSRAEGLLFLHGLESNPGSSLQTEEEAMSLLLSRTQGYCYHLSKFHIYALVYRIGVFLSGLLHSV